MDPSQHDDELFILKTIAETLNRAQDLRQMLQQTLEKLLEVTGIQTGWIFLVGEEPIYHFVADWNLPPALAHNDKSPMKCDDCYCLWKYWRGELTQAVNLIQCERLYQAQGDTNQLTHHATIPLTIRGERFGVLNVGSPGKSYFCPKELTLLESVAYQIGTAVERTRLYEQQKQQAIQKVARFIIGYYENMNEATRSMWHIQDRDRLLTTVVQQIVRHFGWTTVAIFLNQQGSLTLKALNQDGVNNIPNESQTIRTLKEQPHSIIRSFLQRRPATGQSESPPYAALTNASPLHTVAIPLITHRSEDSAEPIGVLYIGRQGSSFSDLEMNMLQVLSDHIVLGLEKISLYEERQALLLSQERNRLARDLHDSVNQKLFSLSLTARGMEHQLQGENDQLGEGIHQMREMAQEALTEMKSLIWQLRPADMGSGLLSSLRQYGTRLGLTIQSDKEQDLSMPQNVEETLWRIGQEALNNVRKHAQTDQVSIQIRQRSDQVHLIISDSGCGFAQEEMEEETVSLGLTSMRERAEQLGGEMTILSKPGVGTSISALIPMGQQRDGVDE